MERTPSQNFREHAARFGQKMVPFLFASLGIVLGVKGFADIDKNMRAQADTINSANAQAIVSLSSPDISETTHLLELELLEFGVIEVAAGALIFKSVVEAKKQLPAS